MAAISNNTGLCEVHYMRNGQVCRKISIIAQGREFVVSEQEIDEDIITKVVTWDTKFILAFPNRNLARMAYLGLMAIAMYEEGGNEFNPALVPNVRQSLDKALGVSRPHPSGI